MQVIGNKNSHRDGSGSTEESTPVSIYETKFKSIEFVPLKQSGKRQEIKDIAAFKGTLPIYPVSKTKV